jgi:hypothetical protein
MSKNTQLNQHPLFKYLSRVEQEYVVSRQASSILGEGNFFAQKN